MGIFDGTFWSDVMGNSAASRIWSTPVHIAGLEGTNEHWPQGSARDGIGMVVAVALPIGEKVPPGSVL